MSSNATLSAAADDRKARLAKLRSIKRKQPDDEVVPPESDRASPAVVHNADYERADTTPPDVTRLHLSGRNYDPEARGAKLGFEAPPNLAAGEDTLEAKAVELENEVRQQQQEEDGAGGDAGEHNEQQKQIDLFKLQPKKPNWDLKRALNKRLEPLNARTENAIARLVRERLAAKLEAQVSQSNAKSPSAKEAGSDAKEDDGEGALEGAALVEGIRIREQEEEVEERRERELEEEEP